MKFQTYECVQTKLLSMLAVVLMSFAIYSSPGWAQSVTPVDINTADAATLAKALTGVGDRIGAAIVKERQSNGPFLSVDDLQRVRGIGVSVVEKNRSKIVIKLDPERSGQSGSVADTGKVNQSRAKKNTAKQ